MKSADFVADMLYELLGLLNYFSLYPETDAKGYG